MRILIDAGHPAHIHYFRNAARLLGGKGHEILFTCRKKDVIIDLLRTYNLPHKILGKHRKSLAGKLAGMVLFDIKLFFVSVKFRPDIYLSAGSIYAAQIAWLRGKPHIVLEDSFNMEQVRLYLPFSSAVITGNYAHPGLGRKEIRLTTYQELAYLHPAYFTPDKNIREELTLGKEEKYFILRFVSWNASHDLGQSGLTLDLKRELISILEGEGRVFISSETDPGSEFEKYRFPLPPGKMHDALAFASLFIGEGATMASECAIMGTMAVYINSIERGYVTDQENKYKLAVNFRNGDGLTAKVKELLKDRHLKESMAESKQKLLEENIDLTAFLVWLTENWPGSYSIVKSDPSFAERFRGIRT